MPKSCWVVRAGRDSVYVQDFLSKGIAAIGWADVGDLSAVHSREQIADLLSKTFPEYTKFQISANAGQIHRFREDLKPGEVVLTYDADERIYHVGKVTGDYVYHSEYDPELRHTRAVNWSHVIPRDRLSPLTKNSLGAISTIFCISEGASKEILDFIGVAPPDATIISPVPDEEEIEVLQDTEQRALEFLQDRLDKLSWQQVQELVGGLLRAMGYKTRIAPFGPDRGRDIIASPDGFGFEPPRIIVEVKHRKGSMGAPEIRAFAGGLRHSDKGLYVSTGGFTKEARYEADRANYPVTLMDATELGKAIVEYYDRMDLESRTLLPMRRIYWPV